MIRKNMMYECIPVVCRNIYEILNYIYMYGGMSGYQLAIQLNQFLIGHYIKYDIMRHI